jgi:hypothetical protein
MKKMFAFIAMIAFVGVSAFSLNLMDKDGKTAENKSECATVAVSSASVRPLLQVPF